MQDNPWIYLPQKHRYLWINKCKQKIKINGGWSLYLPHNPFGSLNLSCQNSQTDGFCFFNLLHGLYQFLHYCYYYPKPLMYCIISQNCYHTYIRKVIQNKFLTVGTHPLFESLFLFLKQKKFLLAFWELLQELGHSSISLHDLKRIPFSDSISEDWTKTSYYI